MKRYIKADIVDLPDEDEDTLVFLAADPNLRPARIQQLFDMHNKYVNLGLAINPSTPPDMLRSFITSPHWQTLSLLAANESTPEDILEQLYDKHIVDVDIALALNNVIPIKLVRKLFFRYANSSAYGRKRMLDILSERSDFPEDLAKRLQN